MPSAHHFLGAIHLNTKHFESDAVLNLDGRYVVKKKKQQAGVLASIKTLQKANCYMIITFLKNNHFRLK